MRRTHRVAVALLATLICGTLGTATATVAVRQATTDRAPAPAAAEPRRGMAALAALPAAPTERLFAIATFRRSARPTAPASALRALTGLGLDVVPLRRLPLAVVAGTRAELEAAVRSGVAADVYPDESLQFHSAESTAAVRADVARAQGVTGRGVGVAVVDTGVDATHPDLADHVLHNFKLIGPEHLDALGGKHDPDELAGTLVVPFDDLPYDNTDTTSGHGTHVAGIVAADAHTSPAQIGVAPDAHLVGYGVGDALSVFDVIGAFDHLLAHHQEWGVRVVNNSWGQAGRMFDPAHPINVATKALHDAGVVVVFSAGNATEEGSINPFSVAPWVISVGSATVTKERSTFSSGGYEHDNSLPAAVPADRHLRFDGDRLGIYHPDVSAPGTDIESSGTPTGVGVQSPALPGGTATLSGTSMSSPHVAGLAALLLQARPSLTPNQVRQVLEVTAVPMGDAKLWQSGYGFVDALAALDLVRRADFGQALLDQRQAAADARVLGARAYKVRTSDHWSFTSQLVSVAGSDTRTFETAVGPETQAVKAVVSYPSVGLIGENPFNWEINVTDAEGKLVGRSTPSTLAGVSSVFVDLTTGSFTRGTWKVEVSGLLGVSDTDALLGNVVSLAVAQLEPQQRSAAPSGFVREGSHTLYFQTSSVPSAVPLPLPIGAPGGCVLTEGAPKARMGGAPHTDGCTAGLVGFPVTYGADTPAEFTATAPLAAPMVVGGSSKLTLWLADPASPVWTVAAGSRVNYALDAVDPAGNVTAVATGDLERFVEDADEVGVEPVRADYDFVVPPTTVPAGSTLRLRLRFSGVYTAAMRMFFGGPFADSGITLGTGRLAG